jgi:hypothetical protein
MAVNLTEAKRKNRNLRQLQDHPIPIESHGLMDRRAGELLNQIRSSVSGIKDQGVRDAIEHLVSSIEIVRENKTQFDSIRRNIETLWKREVGSSTVKQTVVTGAQTVIQSGGGSGGPTTPIIDEVFFAYDLEGEIEFELTPQELTLDTEVRKDTPFAHASDSSEIEFLQGGQFFIDVDCSVDIQFSEVVELKLQLDDGSGWVDLEGSETYLSDSFEPATPAGVDTQVQYNNNGQFGSGSFFTTNKSSNITLDAGGLIESIFNINGTRNFAMVADLLNNLALRDVTAGLDRVVIDSNGTFELKKSLQLPSRSETSATVAQVLGDFTIELDASSNNIDFNCLAAALWTNIRIEIKRTDTSSNTVTINPDGSETIDGAASFAIKPLEVVTVKSNGTNLLIVG